MDLFSWFNTFTGELDTDLIVESLMPGPDDVKDVPVRPNFKPYRRRRVYTRKDPRTCSWYVDYVVNEDGTWNDPSHRNFKLFKNRFVISRDAIMEMVNTIRGLTEEEGKFWDDTHPQCKPLELLVLGSIRMLTRNWTLDCVREATYISTSTIAVFFKKFVHWYRTAIFPKVVAMPDPKDADAITRNGAEYAASGFPGCIGSLDAVHVRQWNIAANLRQSATGKEKYPSRAYQVMVNHRMLVLNCTPGFAGSTNDKTIIRFDKGAMKVRNGEYDAYSFNVHRADGEMEPMRGCYHINDNGYHKWATAMEPTKNRATIKEGRWSEMLESLRKDVECFFGILKQMFAILKYGCRVQDQNVMDDIFFTCVAIYNQLMIQRGADEPWENIKKEYEEEESLEGQAGVFQRMRNEEAVIGPPESGVGLPPGCSRADDEDEEEDGEAATKESHASRKQRLIEHFNYLYLRKDIVWTVKGKEASEYFND